MGVLSNNCLLPSLQITKRFNVIVLGVLNFGNSCAINDLDLTNKVENCCLVSLHVGYLRKTDHYYITFVKPKRLLLQ